MPDLSKAPDQTIECQLSKNFEDLLKAIKSHQLIFEFPASARHSLALYHKEAIMVRGGAGADAWRTFGVVWWRCKGLRIHTGGAKLTDLLIQKAG